MDNITQAQMDQSPLQKLDASTKHPKLGQRNNSIQNTAGKSYAGQKNDDDLLKEIKQKYLIKQQIYTPILSGSKQSQFEVLSHFRQEQQTVLKSFDNAQNSSINRNMAGTPFLGIGESRTNRISPGQINKGNKLQTLTFQNFESVKQVCTGNEQQKTYEEIRQKEFDMVLSNCEDINGCANNQVNQTMKITNTKVNEKLNDQVLADQQSFIKDQQIQREHEQRAEMQQERQELLDELIESRQTDIHEIDQQLELEEQQRIENNMLSCEYLNDNIAKPNTSFNQYRRKIWSAKRADENASASAVNAKTKGFPPKKSAPFEWDYTLFQKKQQLQAQEKIKNLNLKGSDKDEEEEVDGESNQDCLQSGVNSQGYDHSSIIQGVDKDKPFNSFYVNNKTRLSLNQKSSRQDEDKNEAEDIVSRKMVDKTQGTNMSLLDRSNQIDTNKQMSSTQQKWIHRPRPSVITRKLGCDRQISLQGTFSHEQIDEGGKDNSKSNSKHSETKLSDEGATPHVISKELSIKKHMSFGGARKSNCSKLERNNFLDELEEIDRDSLKENSTGSQELLQVEDEEGDAQDPEAEPITPITIYHEGTLKKQLVQHEFQTPVKNTDKMRETLVNDTNENTHDDLFSESQSGSDCGSSREKSTEKSQGEHEESCTPIQLFEDNKIEHQKVLQLEKLQKYEPKGEQDMEKILRELLDLPDIQIFDIHMILQIFRKKYNKNYYQQLGEFNIKHKDERRTPNQWPKVQSKYNNILRNVHEPTYKIFKQEPPPNYTIKYSVDLNDPQNMGDQPPQTTAKAWSIYDTKRLLTLYSKNIDHKLEIASMTKIMTFYTCCQIMYSDLQCINFNPRKIYFRASSWAAKIHGTTAYIQEGLRYSVYDLLIGLMLPSGNDASLVLAENFGRLLIAESCKTSLQSLRDFCEKDPTDPEFSKACIIRFVKRMNFENQKLKLSNSHYSNPHGLSDKANKSSAQDIIRLSFIALKFPLFVEIVSKFQYESRVVYDYEAKRIQKGVLVHQRWYNLNILLKDSLGRYRGIKTGQTPNAGSCLCTHYVDEKKGYNFLCVVIGTQTNKHRFLETSRLINWCVAQQIKSKMANSQQGTQGTAFEKQLRNGSQSGQSSGLSGLAKIGTKIMMNIKPTVNAASGLQQVNQQQQQLQKQRASNSQMKITPSTSASNSFIKTDQINTQSRAKTLRQVFNNSQARNAGLERCNEGEKSPELSHQDQPSMQSTFAAQQQPAMSQTIYSQPKQQQLHQQRIQLMSPQQPHPPQYKTQQYPSQMQMHQQFIQHQQLLQAQQHQQQLLAQVKQLKLQNEQNIQLNLQSLQQHCQQQQLPLHSMTQPNQSNSQNQQYSQISLHQPTPQHPQAQPMPMPMPIPNNILMISKNQMFMHNVNQTQNQIVQHKIPSPRVQQQTYKLSQKSLNTSIPSHPPLQFSQSPQKPIIPDKLQLLNMVGSPHRESMPNQSTFVHHATASPLPNNSQVHRDTNGRIRIINQLTQSITQSLPVSAQQSTELNKISMNQIHGKTNDMVQQLNCKVGDQISATKLHQIQKQQINFNTLQHPNQQQQVAVTQGQNQNKVNLSQLQQQIDHIHQMKQRDNCSSQYTLPNQIQARDAQNILISPNLVGNIQYVNAQSLKQSPNQSIVYQLKSLQHFKS